ncbi:TraI/MobA(P) family conjugative relaxase [Falsiroseomonas sp.]|uniref:TraI/MobA(P) family conjugative relaxase n=1 Tax=Falsiroseomonas sp. TaxID=2870721 RepID=UPI003F71F6A2
MIAKRVRRKGGAGLAALGRYVLREKGAPAGWKRQAEYAADLTHGVTEGGKVAWVEVHNCGAVAEPGRAIQLMEATRQQNARIRAGASLETGYHLVISFEAGECPERDTLRRIEAELVAAVGLADHQRLVAAHQDKKHFHLHVVVNLIHPTSFRKSDPYYDHARLMVRSAELEVVHGLRRTNHGELAPVFLVEVRDRAGADLARAAGEGQDWQEIHQAAARHGLRVKKLGGGLSIARADEARLRVTASAVSRDLSLARLSAKFGPWQDAAPEVRAGETAWDRSTSRPAPQPREGKFPHAPAEGALYGRWQADRGAAIRAKAEAMAKAKGAHRAWRIELAKFYRERVGRACDGEGTPEARRAEAIRRKAERDRDRRARVERVLADTAAINQAFLVPTWQEWLDAKAGEGDADAVEAVRRRGRLAGVGRADGGFGRAEAPDASLRPWWRRDGSLAYSLADGGRLVDHGSRVDLERPTDAASALALRVLADRFGPSVPQAVQGAQAFRDGLASLAGRDGYQIHFSDPALEARRLAAGGRTVEAMARVAEAAKARQQAGDEARAKAGPDRGKTRDTARDRPRDGLGR